MTKRCAVLIPTWRRPKALTALFKKCPDLNSPDTFIGIEKEDYAIYKEWRTRWGDRCSIIPVKNPNHYVSTVREQIKLAVKGQGYAYYIIADDNVRPQSPKAIQRLQAAYELANNPMVAGTHSTGTFFHRDEIAKGEVIPLSAKSATALDCTELTLYPALGMILWAWDATLYDAFRHQPDNYLDDNDLLLWSIREGGLRKFLCVREVEYSKTRHDFKENGMTSAEKAQRMLQSLQVLLNTYPEWAEPSWVRSSVSFRKAIAYMEEQ